MRSKGIEEVEDVHALLIFSLMEEWKQMLLTHGCAFGVHEEYGATIQFPEGSTRTLLYSRVGHPSNRYRILFPDGLEMREVLDDEYTGKSWLLLVLSQEPMQDEHVREGSLRDKAKRVEEEQKKQEVRHLQTENEQ